MAKFLPTSRYARHAEVFKAKDAMGREVLAVTPPLIPKRQNRGTHLTKDTQRLDHLAHHYLAQADAFWSITSHNARILPDAVLAQYRIRIPVKDA